MSQLLGDVAIARRVSAASAAVREHDEALRTVRNRQIAVERDASSVNQDIPFIDIERVRLHVTALRRGGRGDGGRRSSREPRQITCELPNGRVSPSSAPLFSPQPSERKRAVVSPPCEPASRARDATPPNAPHASTPHVPRQREFATPFGDCRWLPSLFRVPPVVSFFPMLRVCAAGAASLRRGALSRVRSRLPVSSIAHRVFLRECDAFLPERTHPPELRVISLPAHPRAPFRSFQGLA